MTLPDDAAADLMSRLDPKQVEAVSIEIARAGHVSGTEQETVVQEFAGANPSSLPSEGGSLDRAKSLIQRAMGKEGGEALENVTQSIEARPFAFLKKIDSQNLLAFILDEHPQTVALILTHLRADQAAEILKGLPGDRQLQVIRRIATMGQTTPEIIREVVEGLQKRVSAVMDQRFDTAGGAQSVAEILNVTDRTTERSLLENLAQEDEELVEDIRRLMFVFEDLARFSDKDMQTVLKNVETSQWALALKGASEPLKRKVMGNMSTRAADLLREEIELLGAVRLSSVEEMQQKIVDLVRRLEDAGDLVLHGEDEDEQFVQ